jgi:hypothetical protein
MAGTSKQAYNDTSVHWVQSQSAIINELAKYKINETRFTNLPDLVVLEFRNPNENPLIGVRIKLPIKPKHPQYKDKELNRMHRVLFHHLKNKLIAVESGLSTFEEEFMPYLIMTGASGSITLGELMLPQYKESLISGKQPEFKLLEGAK